jgi:hypothetical protein
LHSFRKLKKDLTMDLALQRWQVSEDRNVEDLYFGDELASRDEVPANEVMTIIGVNGENNDEDLSTIDAGSYTDEHRIMVTPEKKKKKSGGEDATLPETPTKYGSLASKSISEKSMRRHTARFQCFLLIAFVLGLILLGSISVLSLNLYHIRNPEDSENSSSSAFEAQDKPQFDYSGVTEVPTTKAPSSAAPTEAPVSAPVVPATEGPSRMLTSSPTRATTSSPTMLRATTSPTKTPTTTSPTTSPTSHPTVSTDSPTAGPSTPPPTTNLDVLREELIQAAPISAGALSDEDSLQYSVLEWLVGDPSLDNYTGARVVQRFALGTMFWSLHNNDTTALEISSSSSSSIPNWMTYEDECDWPQTRESQMCDGSGNVTAIYLESVGFSGTLASEISLLSSLGKHATMCVV